MTGAALDSPRVVFSASSLTQPHVGTKAAPYCATTTVETWRQVSLRRIQTQKRPRRSCYRQEMFLPPKATAAAEGANIDGSMPATERAAALTACRAARRQAWTTSLTGFTIASGLLCQVLTDVLHEAFAAEASHRSAATAPARPHHPPV